jgi:hypothetical protein
MDRTKQKTARQRMYRGLGGRASHSAYIFLTGAPIEGQRGTSIKRQGYWIRCCLCKNCIADRVAFGGCHDPPRGGRGERRAAVVLNAKRRTEASAKCLSWVKSVDLAAYRSLPLYPHKQTSVPCVGMSQMCHERSSRPFLTKWT